MNRRSFATTIAAAACVAATLGTGGCGGGLEGLWKGSGEVGEGRFFQFVLDTREDVPAAAFQYAGVEQARLAVCDLKENEKHVEFRMDPDSRAASCDAMKSAHLFVGDYGQDVITGQVLDPSGRRIGMFRAFRAPE
jgi:hypothetical protein